MKLLVTLRVPGSVETRNIQITADATATAHDVAEALGGALGHHNPPPGLTLRSIDSITGHARMVNPQVTLIDSGIQSGAVVELTTDDVTRTSRAAEGAALLRVVSGPDRGVEVELPYGASEIGRGLDCEVRLTDPLVSKRHARIVVIGDRIDVVDLNSSNGVWVDGARVGRETIGPGDVVLLGNTTIAVFPSRSQLDWSTSDVAFIRSPLVLARPEETQVSLPDPPGRMQRSRFPWLVMVAPLLMGVMLYFFTRSPMSIVFVCLSPLMMIGTWATARMETRSRHREAIEDFYAGMTAARDRIADLQDKERQELLTLYPSANECVAAVTTQSDLIWSRRPELPEYLQFRLGVGTVASVVKVVARSDRGLPEFNAKVIDLEESSKDLADAPVVADLRSVGSVGICGPRHLSDGVVRAAVVQLASLHSPAEMLLCVLTTTAKKPLWRWVEWLPHTHSPHSPLELHLAADSAGCRSLVDQLEGLVGQRVAAMRINPLIRGPLDDKEQNPSPVLPSVVVIVDEPPVDRGRITRLAEIGPDAGVHMVWVADTKNELPAACRSYLDVGDPDQLAIGMVRSGRLHSPVACESIDAAVAEEIGRRFAPLIDAGAPIDDESDLPRSVSVVSLLGHTECDQPDVVIERWRENGSLVDRDVREPRPVDGPVELRAIVGHSGLEPFVIDLRRDGPHALVGGTTGAGKSEFLQAWVLGLAHALSPDRVNFLYVDYKGGAAFAKCVELPHAVGIVTDLNPYLVRRVLTSLRAELKRREHILNAKGKKDLIDLEKSGDPECPPSLVIIVDEFAALAGEIPEFVDGMVDIAQRGRSLGLHLILATQRPAGVIKDNLRANTNLRIALRMADEQDSLDVLGSKMAAYFSSAIPGRGAAKSGPGKIVAFQSAYPGARTTEEPPQPPIEVNELSFGVGKSWPVPTRVVDMKDIPKDIDRVVHTLNLAASRAGIPKPRRPWLEELAPIYDLLTQGQVKDSEIILGVRDDPENQAQVVEYFYPEEAGNILYIGAGGSGKTTALRSLAVAASITPQSGPVHIYGMDFAGGGLSMLEPLPNVGSIVTGDDSERIERLIRYLSQVVEERSARFSASRASSLSDYRRIADRPEEPRLLLLLDGFGSFREVYETHKVALYTAFTRLLVDGRACGLHIAMTADRPSVVPTSIASAFPHRMVMRLADADAYSMMGVPKDILSPLSFPGRAIKVGKPQEMQISIIGDDISAAAQARMIDQMARAFTRYHAQRPAPIKSLPSLILPNSLPAQVNGLPVLGVADIDLQPIGFQPSSMILVAGPTGSGKTSAMHWLAHSIKRSKVPMDLYHLAIGRSPLVSSEVWRLSVSGEDNIKETIPKLKELVSCPAEEGRAIAIFIESLAEAISTPNDMPLVELLKLSRKNGHLVIADGDMSSWTGGWPLLAEMRNQRCGLLLQPDLMDGDSILRTTLPKFRRVDLPPGRGFWIKGGAITKVQIPLLE